MIQIIVNLTIIITIIITIITIAIIHIQQTTTITINNTTGGLGANTASTSDSNVKVTTQSAPRTQSTASTQAFLGKTNSGANYYTWGQCTYYVYDKVGGTIGNTWGNANNWANAAAQSGYTVNNTPKAGAVMQTTQVVMVTLHMLKV